MPSELRAATLGFVAGSLTGGLLVGAAAWFFTPPPPDDATVQVLTATEAVLDDYARITRMRDLLVGVSGARLAVAEFMSNHGRAPTGNAEAQLPPADQWRHAGFDSVEVAPEGILVATFAAPLAGQVRYRTGPADSVGGIIIHCSSPDIPDIARIVPGCAYHDQGSGGERSP